MKNPYLVLAIREDATETAIHDAYRAQLRLYPPETNPERFQMLAEAYAALRDPESRAEIDLFGCLETDDQPQALFADTGAASRRRAGMATWKSVLREVANG